MNTLAITRKENGIICVSGELGFSNAADALMQRRQLVGSDSKIAVDLSGLENSDSATLAVLIAWAAYARRENVQLKYVEAPKELCSLARLCDIELLLNPDFPLAAAPPQ